MSKTSEESSVQVQSTIVSINGTNMCLHRWQRRQQQQQQQHPPPTNNTTTSPKALAIVYHGFLAHGLYPTVKYAAECLAASFSNSNNNNNSVAVISVDLPGHGRAEGLPGYLSSADKLLQDAVAICDYARQEISPKAKIFLVGSSMGGTIALNVASKLQSSCTSTGGSYVDVVAGVVLLAPMLRLSVSSLEYTLLGGLASLLSTWQIIPSSSTSPEKQYRDDAKRAECQNDEYSSMSGSSSSSANKCIRVGSAYTCVSLAKQMNADFYVSLNNIPLLIMVADQDVVVDNQGSFDLMEYAVNCPDKTIKHYPALHGLLCEPSPLVEEIEKDLVEWVQARIPQQEKSP